jgi:arylsulfatase A
MRRSLLTCVFATLLSCAAWAQRPPNIIVIMADDMGYESISANGSEDCKSPNIDKLASEGIRFTNGFANPICTPSRVKIMTGMYNVRNYVKFGVLPRGQITFAHQLKKAGYATAIGGKWQLGKALDSPKHFGFDESCLWQHTRPRVRKVDGKAIDTRFVNPRLEINGEPKDYDNGEYGPQVVTDYLCDFIDRKKEDPFFVYFPMILTHCPFDPTPDSTDWDPKRPGSSDYKGDKKDYQRHFADMVNYADKMVGQIVAQLEKSGVRENTLLVFTGDNGTDAPIVTNWNGGKVKGGKGSVTDEGTRVPLVINWPSGIKTPGRVTDELVDHADFLPTICEATGAPLPDKYAGDGKSLMPIFTEKGERNKDYVYVWYRGKVMVRNKAFSLVAKTDGSDAKFIRYKGPYDGENLADGAMSEPERVIKAGFMKTLKDMAELRGSHFTEKPKPEQPKGKKAKADKKKKK